MNEMSATATIKSEVFLGDCMDFMRQAKDKQWDLAIVDPPFGIGVNYQKGQRHKNHGTYTNASSPGPEYFKELARVSHRSIIWGCQYYLWALDPEGSFIIWDKKADPDTQFMSSCDVAWYSKRSRIRTFDGIWCGAVKIDNEQTIHVHQKPLALYRWLLKHYADPGDAILDTHMGSQSSRIAAYDMGFDYTGFELDPDYFAAGCKRFEQHKAQLKMF